MILADKIIENRKKNGWSQEELAEQLGVSRQSISKWEGAQSIPDMKKIIQLSEIFGVSTDYLIKDEIEVDPGQLDMQASLYTGSYAESVKDAEPIRIVTMEEANAFLNHNEWAANKISLGVMLCILSPVILIALAPFAESERYAISEPIAVAIGMAFLFGFVGVAVALFLLAGFRGKPYEFLEKDSIETAYGVSGMAKERRDEFSPIYARNMIIGILLCFLAVVPLVVGGVLLDDTHYEDIILIPLTAILLTVISIGVKLIVHACIIKDGNDKLLEEGDFTRRDKRASKYDGVYWAIVTAIFLGWSFISFGWNYTWIVWPIAGVVYAAYHEIMKSLVGEKKR